MRLNQSTALCGRSSRPREPFQLKHRSWRYFIWHLKTSRKNGQCLYGAGVQRWTNLLSSSVIAYNCDEHKEPAFGGTVLLSLSLNSQNKIKVQRRLMLSLNLLSRHHPDARVALQQSPILHTGTTISTTIPFIYKQKHEYPTTRHNPNKLSRKK